MWYEENDFKRPFTRNYLTEEDEYETPTIKLYYSRKMIITEK